MKIIEKDNYTHKIGSRWELIEYGYEFWELKNIIKDLEALNALIKSDFSYLLDGEFFELISNFYTIFLTKKDILNILSEINGIEYDCIHTLQTTMTFKERMAEGIKKDRYEWNETFTISYIVASSKDAEINVYNTKNQIKEMIKNNQIVCLGKLKVPKGECPKLPFEPEPLEEIDFNSEVDFGFMAKDREFLSYYINHFNVEWLKNSGTNFNKEVYKNIMSKIRTIIDKKKVMEDCKRYLLFLKENLDVLPALIKNDIQNYSDEEEQQEYFGIISQIKIKQKELALKL